MIAESRTFAIEPLLGVGVLDVGDLPHLHEESPLRHTVDRP